MHVIRYQQGNSIRYGILSAQSVTPIRGTNLEEAMKGEPDGAPVPLSEIDILSPVARPGKILGIGVNYAAHAAESVSFVDTKKPEIQKWFNKQATAINDPYADVELPKVSHQLDYEGELVVVIGKRGRHVPRERAFEIVAGVTIGCDYSVRDWQRASQTMIMGKGFDTHAPVGPAIVTLDEIDDLSALEVRTFVNGEQRQSGHVRDMVHDIPAQIAHLTAAFTLEPGDLIFTGTPAGVGAGFDPPKWLKAGDRVRVEIDALGYMEQQIVTEPGRTVIG
ncbi:fumarylacetoacetate hydrolase family protein [Hyphomonas sp.]|uniref:fumarylacetoacetate hydrolase family protein n=1 Tax=Hyphomonas sp. TaxID=87 RepID=UPI000C54AB28|nr:fumarylacetoacetate hydrolase family protein [Hyphomonas sp.]MAB10523.1 fumarylacetoacetate hydrolase [Hyphomonas sp.]MAU68704.1 fumarylacetoacetate hydrolase [Hyphomonas sp.]MBM59247.1 fumarylacetoacetate hydrolase [Hyphomonas sp.]